MKQPAIQVQRYDKLVWENPTAEAIRKEECLCHNCAKLKPKQPDNCVIAQKFYQICVDHGCAFVLSRCEAFEVQQ